jgi:hypothetical protein
MDVFYYWKDIDADLKAGRLGYFRSSRARLMEFQAASPDNIWIFKTPPGRKGELQLLARLRWADKAVTPVRPPPGESMIFYDPTDPRSVKFLDTDSESALQEVTHWAKTHFHASFKGNFHGELGQQALRGDILKGLERLATGFAQTAFVEQPSES